MQARGSERMESQGPGSTDFSLPPLLADGVNKDYTQTLSGSRAYWKKEDGENPLFFLPISKADEKSAKPSPGALSHLPSFSYLWHALPLLLNLYL